MCTFSTSWQTGHLAAALDMRTNRVLLALVFLLCASSAFALDDIVDTDGDGLSDLDEMNIHGTDPNNVDTDGGGVWDGTELSQNMDPLDPADDPCTDTDDDGICNDEDPDDDNDGVEDAADAAPLDPKVCGDADADTCDDCSVGTDGLGPLADNNPVNDGLDTDGDGICDAGDPDDDNDGVEDANDVEPLNPDLCGDADADTCDDCSVGTDDFGPLADNNPVNDGLDTDGDGICDAGDSDDDNDGVRDTDDVDPRNPDLCGDADLDTCDDCSVGTDGFGPLADNDASNDGADTDGDGICDLGDLCTGNDATGDSDSDGVCDDVDLCTGDDATGDADSDGWCRDRDCNDSNGQIFPGATELCGDNIDNDCDGAIDEGCGPPSGSADPAFPLYGNFHIVPDSFPGIVGVTTNIDVLVSNEGGAPTGAFDIELSFNDWGITYSGWQTIGMLSYGSPAIPPAGSEQQTYTHVFANRAHTCLQAQILNTAAGENADTTNDRAQINWEVVHADADYDIWVPFGNAADVEIDVEDTTISCFEKGAKVACLDRLDGEPNPNEPVLEGAPGADGTPSTLGANEEQVAMVRMPEVAEGGMVVLVEATLNGQLNNVMISVVKTTVTELLNAPHLCCIESVKTRVLLESILAEALDAYDAKNCKLALKLLRMFVQKAILLECDLSDAEIACIEKAILKVVDAGIMIARELGKGDDGSLSTAQMAALMEAHFFRRAGLYEAALLEAAKAC